MMSDQRSGPIAWMTRNSVAANLFMLVLIFGGLIGLSRTTQEVLPEFELDSVYVAVAYPGASPAEVEQGIVLALEESIISVEGVKKINASASEGAASMTVELLQDADPQKTLNEIKNSVDRITTFPQDAEEPIVQLLSMRSNAISLIISGDQPISTLQQIAEKSRESLREHPDISLVDVSGVPARELSIEIPRETLMAHGLTLDEVAQQVSASSLELPAGGLKTTSGELLIRLGDRKKTVTDFQDIVIRSNLDGAKLKLGKIAQIDDGYVDDDQASYFNGKPAVRVVVYRVGRQTPIAVADAVKEHAEQLKQKLPESITVTTWSDQSRLLKGRISLLMKNAKLGLVLVFFVLAFFLDFRLAFWVSMGIPITFLGSFWLLPASGATINMISLFAYIVTLGLVVDDAIVVGENIFDEREKRGNWLDAAVHGARRMAAPVNFAVLTTIAAFAPLLIVPGVTGKFFQLIPAVVISVLILSLLESFFILPAHLGHLSDKPPGAFRKRIDVPRAWIAGRLKSFTDGPFEKVLRFCVGQRYATLALSLSMLILSFGLVGSGAVPFRFFPDVAGDKVTVSARLPYGVPVEQAEIVRANLEESFYRSVEEVGGSENLVNGLYTMVGSGPMGRSAAKTGSHLLTMEFSLKEGDGNISANEFSKIWQKNTPEMSGLESLKFDTRLGPPGAGSAIDIQLNSSNLEMLQSASEEITARLSSYEGLRAIDNSFASGKNQLDFQLKAEARDLGLTSQGIARQVRSSFYGSEALREQVGRFERRTMIRLPESQRVSEYDIGQLHIKAPSGAHIPLEQLVEFKRNRSPTSIKREDGFRIVNVRAELAPNVVSSREILASIGQQIFPEIKQKYPDIRISFAGEQRSQAETFSSLGPNYLMALFAIYALLAIPFKSYIQPFIIMSAIPFGFIGAILGHMFMGVELSIMSMFGVIALTGVVVNDSLVLIDAVNEYRAGGTPVLESIIQGAKRRLRPIVLTSFTTFFGLAPMIFETELSARFLIPMAISIGFGVIFATIVILLLVPSLCMIHSDIKGLFGSKESHSKD